MHCKLTSDSHSPHGEPHRVSAEQRSAHGASGARLGCPTSVWTPPAATPSTRLSSRLCLASSAGSSLPPCLHPQPRGWPSAYSRPWPLAIRPFPLPAGGALGLTTLWPRWVPASPEKWPQAGLTLCLTWGVVTAHLRSKFKARN